MNLLPLNIEIESKAVLRKASSANKALAELKGIVRTIPNQNILNDTLILREARESSAIENIISTFDEVYQSNQLTRQYITPEVKEVYQYVEALKLGQDLVLKNRLLTVNYILQIQEVLIQNKAGFRRQPGTVLKNDITGQIVYTPPQDYESIISFMRQLEEFINNDELMNADPLVKMAIIHHQFESIHPFYDGNGRTGRIINILYLLQKDLLDFPVLYLSRYIIQSKSTYYALLQKVRDEAAWEDWILYMLNGIEQTARQSISLIEAINQMMDAYRSQIRKKLPKIYSAELLHNLFKYPYTKIEFVQQDLNKSRNTAISYLEGLVKEGFLLKEKKGRDNFYINRSLFDLLSGKKYHSPTMKKYRGLAGNTGVTAYEISDEAIIIEFNETETYLYDYINPGKEHVEQMKVFAEAGRGLTTYINKYVRANYRKKLQ